MYGDVDGVAPLVDDLYHLLESPTLRRADRHTNQPAKLANAVVYVNHVVANLKLLYLFQRQSHLASSGLVALQVVLVETVEDLMVGEATHAQVMVYEALVQRAVDAFEGKSRFFGKDVFQSLNLLLAVGQHIELVPLQKIVLQSYCQQVEVLVEERLGRGIEPDGHCRGRA